MFFASLFVVLLMLMTQICHAGLSGRFDLLAGLDNREIRTKAEFEEWLEIIYDQPVSGLRSGLSLALRQKDGVNEAQFYQLYLQKALSDSGDNITLGRFQQADALGFYSLDGVRFKFNGAVTTLMAYSGKPHRIEALRPVDADNLSGFDLYLREQSLGKLALDGRIGWQVFKQGVSSKRLNLGLRGKWHGVSGSLPRRKTEPSDPFTFSLAGTYLPDEALWKVFQVNLRGELDSNARLRLDYETFEPGTEMLTFRDRFYSLYGRDRQTQFKAGYQFNTDSKDDWSLSGRHVVREAGDDGYGGAIGWRHHDDRGMHLEAQLDHLSLSRDHTSSFYVEAGKPLTANMRAVLGGVLQYSQKHLMGDNRAVGFEARLQRILRIDALPSGLFFSALLSGIWNSRLENEYRLAMRLSYSFNQRSWESRP